MECGAAGEIHFIMLMKGAGGRSPTDLVPILMKKGGGINIRIINQNTDDKLDSMLFRKMVGAEKKPVGSWYDPHSLIICYQSAAVEPHWQRLSRS